SKAFDAALAAAIVPIEVVDDESVDSLRDPEAHPSLEHLAPGGMVETGPVLAHAADRIALRRDRIPTRVLLEEVERARSRSRAQERFIPAVTIELEEAARPVRALGVADEEFDVHVTDDARAASVDLAIEAREPVGAFALTSHR